MQFLECQENKLASIVIWKSSTKRFHAILTVNSDPNARPLVQLPLKVFNSSHSSLFSDSPSIEFQTSHKMIFAKEVFDNRKQKWIFSECTREMLNKVWKDNSIIVHEAINK